MKTIFDHNPSKSELASILNNANANENWYVENFPNSDTWCLCLLFDLRGDNANFNKHFAKLTDQEKMDFMRLAEH